MRYGMGGRCLVLLPYQEGPVCRCDVDWEEEEAASKTWTMRSFEEASMVPWNSVVIVGEFNHLQE